MLSQFQIFMASLSVWYFWKVTLKFNQKCISMEVKLLQTEFPKLFLRVVKFSPILSFWTLFTQLYIVHYTLQTLCTCGPLNKQGEYRECLFRDFFCSSVLPTYISDIQITRITLADKAFLFTWYRSVCEKTIGCFLMWRVDSSENKIPLVRFLRCCVLTFDLSLKDQKCSWNTMIWKFNIYTMHACRVMCIQASEAYKGLMSCNLLLKYGVITKQLSCLSSVEYSWQRNLNVHCHGMILTCTCKLKHDSWLHVFASCLCVHEMYCACSCAYMYNNI